MKLLEGSVIGSKKPKGQFSVYKKKRRLFYQLFPTMLGITLVSISIVLAISHFAFRNLFYEQTADNLADTVSTLRFQIADALEENDLELARKQTKYFASFTNKRITLISANGDVIFDSEADYDQLGNHAGRPEFQEALSTSYGKSIRYSRTSDQELIYVAIAFKNKKSNRSYAIRASIATVELKQILYLYYSQVMWFVIVFIFILIFANWIISQKISRPLEIMKNHAENYTEGNLFEFSLEDSSPSVEIISLTHSLNKMSQKIQKQFKKIANQKEEREVVFSSMTEGVLSIDLNGNVFHWNQAVCKLFDVPPNETLKGMPFTSFFSNEELLAMYIQIQENPQVLEKEIILPNNKVLQVHGSLLSSPVKPKLGTLFVFNDITKLRKLENHRKEFVANVSHELRTPLTAMQGFIETLLENDVDTREVRDKFLTIIKKHTYRLSQIIEDLLALSNFEKEQDESSIKFETHSIKEIIQNSIQLNQTKADKRDITLDFQFDEQSDSHAEVNAHLLEQAISNLIDNAIKYSPNNTSVQVELKDKATSIEINIADQGPGIPKEHLPRLFERFYSVDKARSREMGGSGLGLAIVKHIILVHSGEIDVKSELGKGCRFTISVPISKNHPNPV